MNRTEQCPCCGRSISLVRDGIIESHLPPSGQRHGNLRSGNYCEATGYTVDQARRWSALTIDQKRAAISSPWSDRAITPAQEAR